MLLPKTYHSPWTALLWSAMMPGLGQLYNRDYGNGILLIVLEFIVNYFSCINCMILFEFNNTCFKEITNSNLHWMMFYPSLYSFGMWQAFNCAVTMNQVSDGHGHGPDSYPKLTGLFIGFGIGMLLGIIWPYRGLRIITGLGIGLIGMLIGHGLELVLCQIKLRKK